jgi:serine/threonine-protein kinase
VTARVGTTLKGKYRLDSVLGVGGMAAVYAATHRNSKRFAIKMLHPELSLRSDIRTRFLREGYVATQVEHPGAVSVLDDDVAEDGSAFLVMELLEGATVDALWERCGHRLPLSSVLAIGHQLVDVLAAAHARSIVHRDIKPENLFITTEGQLKVLDFGIARLKDAASSSATNTGVVLGTPVFMAPEQAMGKISEIGPQSDLWAATPPSSSSTVDNDAPTKIRPGAAQAIRLERAARQPGLTTDQPVWNEGKATGPSRQKLAWIALAAGVLATALVTAVLLRPREQGDSPALAPATAAPGPSATTSAAGAPEQPLPPKSSEPATVSLDQLPRELPRKAQANPAAMAPAPAAKTASGPALHAATPSPPSAPAAQVPAAKSNCSPPYSLDPATGIKRWKPECM